MRICVMHDEDTNKRTMDILKEDDDETAIVADKEITAEEYAGLVANGAEEV